MAPHEAPDFHSRGDQENRNGDAPRALQMVDRLAEMGVEAFKFQLTRPALCYSLDVFKPDYQRLSDNADDLLEASRRRPLNRQEHRILSEGSGDRPMKSLDRCTVSLDGRIKDAMETIDRGAVEIALVLDGGRRLVGTLTDGDVRRALLRGASLDSPLAPYVHRNFTAVGPATGRAEVLDLMQARRISQIPILDAEGCLIGLHLLHEMIGTVERPNWAVIMAGGKGTRLRPITEHIPKPMIPVAGRPILERLVLHLVGFGIRRIFLAINYLGHLVEQHFADGRKFGCQIEYLRESRALGTGGALALLPEQPHDPILVMNGDLVTQVDPGALLQFHVDGGYVATVGVREYAHVVPFGCVEVSDQRITRFDEKPLLTRLINTGIYALSPQILGRVPKDCEYPITQLIDECLQQGEPVGAFLVQDDWIDVGQREQLRLAREGSTEAPG